MAKPDFNARLKSEVRRISDRFGFSESKAFLFWFACQILELSESDALEAISVEGANDKGIDIFWIDDDSERVIVGQGKYSKTFSYKAKETDVNKLESSLNWLSNPESLRREGKTELAQAAEDYIEAIRDGYSTELIYFYAGFKSNNVEKHVRVYNQNADNIDKSRSIRHYHRALIEATWQELFGSPQRITEEKISLRDGKVLDISAKFGDAVVANVPGVELARLYETYQDRLFDRNVRLYLGSRTGSVNAGIIETLGSDDEQGNFWAYNNGITILCDHLEAINDAIRVKNFSIINGCQTTVSIAQHAPRSKDVLVLTRFIAPPEEIVDNIIRFNNSQNPIRMWDIASQDKTQRRLKSEFDELKKPYIYLTRRGSRPTGNLRRYRDENKRLRQIRIDVAGQYAAAFGGMPVVAYKNKAYIFTKYKDEVFPPDVRAEDVLFQWMCGELCVDVVRERILHGDQKEVQILKKGGALFVLAIMSQILANRNGSTYLHALSEDNISGQAARRRLKKYAEYALDAYTLAVSDLAEIEGQELNTLIRSRDFYERVKERVLHQYRREARARRWIEEALPALRPG